MTRSLSNLQQVLDQFQDDKASVVRAVLCAAAHAVLTSRIPNDTVLSAAAGAGARRAGRGAVGASGGITGPR
jgi:hypothetical protein